MEEAAFVLVNADSGFHVSAAMQGTIGELVKTKL